MNKTVKNKDNISKGRRFIKAVIFAFVMSYIAQSILVVNRVYNEAWVEAAIPYDVKTEWTLNKILNKIKGKQALTSADGFFSKILRKSHNKVYLSAKSKIPYNDPFWTEFRHDSTYLSEIKTNTEVKSEIINVLHHVANNDSKVIVFDLYKKYFYIAEILSNILSDLKYLSREDEVDMYKQALQEIYPIIDSFTKTEVDFYENKYRMIKTKYIPEDFIYTILVMYMRIIEMDNKEVCNNSLREMIFNKILSLINNKKKIHFFIKEEELLALNKALNGMNKKINKLRLKNCSY